MDNEQKQEEGQFEGLIQGLIDDKSPMGGRMVFFKSDEMEHEVHPSFTRERISIAGWLKA